MNKQQQVIQIKKQLGKKFKSMCAICHTPDSQWKKRRGFTFHHLQYIVGEKIHSDFADKLEYYQYLTPIIKEFPKRFMYLCNKCHYALTNIIRYSDETFRRLVKARRMSR